MDPRVVLKKASTYITGGAIIINSTICCWAGVAGVERAACRWGGLALDLDDDAEGKP